MNRLALVVLCVLVTAAGAGAQVAPFYSPTADIEVQAGSAVLTIQRVTPPAMLTGQPLGPRWHLELAGFGHPIRLDGRPAATMPLSSGFTDVTDARKRLTSRTDRRGNAVSIAYDGQGRVTTVKGPKNVTLTLTRDRAGRVLSIRTPRGDVIYSYVNDDLSSVSVNGGAPIRYRYGIAVGPNHIDDPLTGTVDISYDGSGRVASRRYADGAATSARQDVNGGFVDANGQRWLTEWDVARLTAVETAPDGAITRTTFDAADRVSAIIDPAGRRTAYEYDSAEHLAAIVHPSGERQTFEYDRFGSLTSERVNGQLVRSFTYHPDGTLASARGLEFPERRYTYTPSGLVSTIVMASGATTTYEYDARGNAIRQTNPLTGVTTRTYDAQNRLTGATDPAGANWKYRYDDRGRLVEFTEPSSGTVALEWDARGRVVAVSGAAGRTTFKHDAVGRVVEMAQPGQRPETFAYDPRGSLVRHVGADGVERSMEYSAAGRLMRERVTGGAEVSYRYDPAGEPTGLTRAGSPTEFELDAGGRVIRERLGANAWAYEYDPLGRLAAIVDPLGRARRVAYGAGGHVSAIGEPGLDEVLFGYDLAGNRTSVRRASGGTDRLSYDALGNVVSVVSPLGSDRRTVYDSAARPVSITDAAGKTIRLEWDAAGRLRTRDAGDGNPQQWSYDTAGRVVEARDTRSQVRYTRDPAGRVTAVLFSPLAKTVKSSFDDRGRRVSMTDGDGRETRYEHNPLGQVVAMQLPDKTRVTFSYDSAGQLRGMTYPNGIAAALEYDGRGRVVRVAHVSAANEVIARQDYQIDNVGNVTERRREGNRVTRYAYDAADQLIDETIAGARTTYQYAPGGNRAAMSRDGVTTTYYHDADDRVTAIETVSAAPSNRRGATPTRARTDLMYDARGALVRRTGAAGAGEAAFDAFGRLVSMRASAGSAITFEYSVDDLRLRRQDAGGVTSFIYDGLDLIAEIDGTGRTTASYAFAPGIDRPIVMWKAGQPYYFHADRDGSILAMTDAKGRVVSRYEYDAFGMRRSLQESVASPFGFAGREFDRATQLYYFRARYYDPSIGRFVSPDPVDPDDSEPLSFHPYLYGLNNPLRYSDPMGLSPDDHLAGQQPKGWHDFLVEKRRLRWLDQQTPRGNPGMQRVTDWVRSLSADPDKSIGLDEETPKHGTRMPPKPGQPGVRDTGFRPPLYGPGPPATTAFGIRPAPGVRDQGFRRPLDFARPPIPAPPLSSEELIDRMLRKPGELPRQPVAPAPPRPSLPADSAEQTIADLLKGKPRPPLPPTPVTVKAPVPVTPPTAAPVAAPVTAPPVAAPPAAGTTSPASEVQTPRGLVPLTIVLTVGQLQQCGRERAFWECVGEAGWKLMAAAPAAATVYLVTVAVNGTKYAVLGTGIATVGAALTTYKAIEWSSTSISSDYQSYLDAKRAMDDAEAAIAKLVVSLNRRLGVATGLRTTLTSDGIARRAGLNEVGTTIIAIATELDTLERDIASLEDPAVVSACRQASAIQAELRDLRTAASREFDAMVADLKGMSTRLSECTPPADADAALIRSRAGLRQGVLDVAVTRAADARRRLLDEIRAFGPSRAGNGRSVPARLTDSLRRIDGTLRDLDEAAKAGNSDDMVTRHEQSLVAIQADLDVARTLARTEGWKEWVVDANRTRVVDLQTQFANLQGAINEERRRMSESNLANSTRQTREREDELYKSLSAVRARRERLSIRASEATCNFTDSDELDLVRRIQGDARVELERADTAMSAPDRCTSRTAPVDPVLRRPSPVTPPPSDRTDSPTGTTPITTPAGAGPAQPRRVLSAVLDCGDVLELEAGGRTELCAVHVRGWDSTTRTPVEVRIQPPFSPASRLSASPGDTSMGGDVMYASGVQNRPDAYIFSEGWRAERGAPTGSTTVVVIVRQGAEVVRLPLTVNVIARGAPTGSSLEPPTPNITGSGGPYCVWQYKLLGDPVGCWHMVAAGCTEPRYANRPAYVMVGNNMTRGQADTRIGELSRYFGDQNCRVPAKTTDPWGDADKQPTPIADPPVQPQPPSPPPAPEPPPGPVSRFSRFGISPRDSTIKVGETIALKAYATANGAPDMVLTLDEREVRWSGDKPPTFTATAADAGRTFSITATGPAGERDTVRITVERPTLPGILPRPPVPAPAPPPAPGPVVNGPAPAGALGLIDKVVKPSRTDGQHVTTLGEATCETRFTEGPKNFRIASWSFSSPPPHLVGGQEHEVTISASLQQEPRVGSQSYPNVAVIHFTGFDVTKDSAPAQVIITDGQVKTTPGRYRFTLRPGVTKAVIGYACDGPGTFATYTYGVK